MKKRLLILLLIFFVISSLTAETKVLFLGNSYTAGNDLPGLVRQLAETAGHDIYVNSNTPGGYTLRYHYEDATSMSLIDSEEWDYVVLQEQSQIPVIPYFRDSWMLPYAELLCDEINSNCARVVFFMAWGAEIGGQECNGGYCSIVFDDYFHQQDSVSASYEMTAEASDASCAPAGLAWRLSREIDPSIGLWSGDGRHPNLNGSYLAACAIYAAIFEESPEGISYHSSLDAERAEYLQEIADSVVMTEPERWVRDAITPTADFLWYCEDGEAFFTTLSTNADNFFWDFGDGDISTEENPSHLYDSDGEYEVTHIALGACQSDTSIQTVYVSDAAVVEERRGRDFGLYVYPNPCNGSKVHIQTEDHNIESISLFDISGKKVFGEILLNNSPNKDNAFCSLKIDKLPEGVYLLRIESTKYNEIRRISIIH